LVLTRPLGVIDLESTGVDPSSDRVVEVAVLTLDPKRPADLFHTRVNPGLPIPPAATAVHGLTAADVRDAPTFATVAKELAERLVGCDLVGFGLASFDLSMLCAEFARAGVPFDLGGRAILDALALYRRHESRTLTAAVRFYLGREHAQAHSAVGDAIAAAEVLDAQVARYALPPHPADIHALLHPVDVGGKFCRENGAVVFAFGKHAGRPLAEVARAHPDYLEWVLTRAFFFPTCTPSSGWR